MKNVQTAERVKKSVKLTARQKRRLAAWVKKQDSKIDAAKIIGIHRNTLSDIQAAGSCNSVTLEKLNTIIN